MVQEARDRWCVQISQGESSEIFLPLLREVGKQEAEGVAIGRHGLPARVLLLDQAIEEESLNQRGKGRSRGIEVHEGFPGVDA